MSVNTIEYAPTLSADTFRGPSKAIWADCPVHDLIENPLLGQYLWDDFNLAGNAVMSSAYKNSIGQWTVYSDAGGTIVDGALEGGVIQIGSDGDNEEVTLFASAGAFRLLTTSTLALNGKLWFECRIAKSSIAATKADTFIGLHNVLLSSGIPYANSVISATDNTLVTTGDLLGFHSKGNAPTEMNFAFCLTSGTVNYPTGMTTLMNTCTSAVMAANAFHKFGFLFDPQPRFGAKAVSTATARQTVGQVRKPLLRVFVDGQECPTFLDSDDVANATATQAFPTAFMSPVMSTMNQTGSSPPTLLIDWIRVAQLGNS